jgi:HNH endonuclease
MEGEKLLAELLAVLSYEPETGKVRWLRRVRCYGGFREAGEEAGTAKDGYTKIIYTDSEGVRHELRRARLAWFFMTGRWPKEVDHIDRDRSNDKWSNLREVTRTENNLNAGLRADNVSTKRGVSWVAGRKMWLARLTISKRIVLSREFHSLDEAIAARKDAEIKYLGKKCPS